MRYHSILVSKVLLLSSVTFPTLGFVSRKHYLIPQCVTFETRTSLERNHYENKGMSVHNHVISDATRYTIQRILDKGHRGPRRHYFAQERTKCKTF
ncbi:hypothetical protein J6590_087747 [Homalodisca vitripennis]|nr:hypothetical protein J6590_087747 [Homalodisca vitripennis]